MTLNKRRFKLIPAYVVLLAMVLTMLVPVFYMISMSFKTGQEIASDPLGLPSGIFLGNYTSALADMNYWRSVANSIGITLSVTVIVSVIGAMAAYPLARRTGTFSRIILMIVALGLATPNFITITPVYVMFRSLGLLDTYLGIILAFTALNLPIAIFFYVGFIGTIPRDLEEAARIDGASQRRIFWHIIWPLLKPMTATLSLFVMLMVWNDFTYPLLLLTEKEKFTVMIAVYRFVGNLTIQPTMLFPAAVLGSLPLLLMFLIFQRRIVSGITSGAVK